MEQAMYDHSKFVPTAPLLMPRLTRANASEMQSAKLFLNAAGDIYVCSISDIIYLEASGGCTFIHLKTGKKIISSKKLAAFEEALQNYFFCRVHNSCLVNLTHVNYIAKKQNGWELYISEIAIPVAVRRREQLRIELLQMCERVV